MKLSPLRLLKFVVACAVFFAAPATLRAADDLRFLFLIDQSPEMATRQIASAQAIYDIIRTGFQNQIQPGEKFALWFYGSRLQTNAPFTWQTGREIGIARAAANLFSGRIYSRMRPREQTLADAAPFIAASPKITIFIVTDGSQPLAGTPFDTTINAAIDNKRIAFMSADKPFIITLMVKNGNWVDGNVYTNLTAPFQIPEMDRRNDLMDKALAAVRTAPSGTPQNAGDNEMDKARAALRDALSGKTPTASATPPIVAKLDFAPTLKEPPKEEPKPQEETKRKEEVQPKEPKADAPVVAPQITTAEKPNSLIQKTETPAPSPLIAQKPTEPVAPPQVAQIEKTVESKPVVHEDPKPILREQPKAPPEQRPEPLTSQEPKQISHVEPKPVVREEPKTLAPQLPPALTKVVSPPANIAEQPKTVQAPVVDNSPPKPAPAPAAVQTAVITPSPKHFPWSIVFSGLGLILIGACIALLRARQRAKSPGSIITQALPRIGTNFRK